MKKAADMDDRVMISRILDKAVQAEKTRSRTHSEFLDPRQQGIVDACIDDQLNIHYFFDGGYEGAERKILIFDPCSIFPEEFDTIENDTETRSSAFKVIHVQHSGKETLNHRNYLGSLMSLGIKREKVGDIIVGDRQADIIVLPEVADYLLYQFDRVGHTRVQASVSGLEDLKAPAADAKEIHSTVASLRLDCVAGVAFGMSRSKIAELIKAEKVSVNWQVTGNTDRQVKQGDVLTLRGKGRAMLEDIGGRSKKDRINIVLKKFI